MASITLNNVSLRYPVFTPQGRAIKSNLLSRLGGTVTTDAHATYVQALKSLDLELGDGDRLGIIGHNGSGKTTLLRVLSGIYEPQEGTVDVNGKVSCFVDITLGMDVDCTGWENIALRGAFMGLTFDESKALAPSIAEFSELGEYLNMPVRTYSSGMFMRLAFAITTSVPQEIIIMDEMIGAGDAQFLDKAVARVTALLGDAKILAVATHSNFIIRRFCNKVLWMEKGQAKALGPVDEVIAAYEKSVKNGSSALGI
jgi:ABC-type polysaccharide/polyol phosphate transport system ATPase subunit